MPGTDFFYGGKRNILLTMQEILNYRFPGFLKNKFCFTLNPNIGHPFPEDSPVFFYENFFIILEKV